MKVCQAIELPHKAAKEKWHEFEDVPMDPETECIEQEWNGFPEGTHREEIWHWFEENYGVMVYDLMYRDDENDERGNDLSRNGGL